MKHVFLNSMFGIIALLALGVSLMGGNPVQAAGTHIDSTTGMVYEQGGRFAAETGNKDEISTNNLWMPIGVAHAQVFFPSGASEGQPAFPFAHYAIQIAAGQSHTCVLTSSGGAECWGYNSDGQLGDGTTTQRFTPVSVSGLTSGVSAIATFYLHTCALTSNGGVKCWGYNSGQLGDGTTTARSTPVDVSGLTSGVSAIAVGGSHSCALTTSGGVKCWGVNSNGQLGDGTTTNRTTPVDVSGLTSGVSAIAAGSAHTCALTNSSGVKCWGRNSEGQLGDGTNIQKITPGDVIGLTGGVSTITMGAYHSCALTSNGGVKCWGGNSGGELGDGSMNNNRTTPVDVRDLTNGVSAIAAGFLHTCALTNGGGLKCWGRNSEGELGDGTYTYNLGPSNVIGLTSGVSTISAGGYHSCALTSSGNLKCWGYNYFGQLGDGSTITRTTPVNTQIASGNAAAITAGQYHTCVITSRGGVKCWGRNADGQLGDGTVTQRATAVDVVGLTSDVSAIATFYQHTCALTSNGGVKCWGYNYSGQIGDGTLISRSSPVDVSGLTNGVSAIAVGHQHSCALTNGGGIKCWGLNNYGQLGDGTTTNRTTPVDVSGLTSGVSAIATSVYHTCALTSSGVKCWGRNSEGQLGDGTNTQRTTPVNVTGLGSGVSAITMGSYYTCALTSGGGVKCWGSNDTGQLGDGTMNNTRVTPVDVSGLDSGVSAIAAGYFHTCALTNSGGVKCWGRNSEGELGDGTITYNLRPVDVIGLASGMNAIAAGGYHTCALTSGGGLKCWGYNNFNQLGDGTTADRITPAQTSGQLASAFTRLNLSLTPSNLGQAVHFTAQLSGTANHPSGTVQFKINGENFGDPATISGGVAISTDTSTLPSGAHLIQAFYSGDSNFIVCTSAGAVQIVANITTPTSTLTNTPTYTSTFTPSPTPTITPTLTPTYTESPSPTNTATVTPAAILPVTITVLDTNGDPASGLAVYAFNGSTYTNYSKTTDANGQAVFTLPQGSYRFRSDKNGTQFWSGTSNHCSVPGCESASVVVTVPVTITVLDSNGNPASGLAVYAFNGSTYTNYSKTTDANGQAVFTLPQGSYRFRSDKNGTQFWSGTSNHCSVPGCESASIVVTVPVTITVLDSNGNPASGLAVYAFNGSTYTNYSKTTDANGQAVFTLPQGSYRFRTDVNGVQYWSSLENHCLIPGIESIVVNLP